MKQPETDLSKKPSFRCRRENLRTWGNLRKQAWTGNQIHKGAGTKNQTRDSLVQSRGRITMLTCFDLKKENVFLKATEIDFL